MLLNYLLQAKIAGMSVAIKAKQRLKKIRGNRVYKKHIV